MCWTCGLSGEEKDVCRIFVQKPLGKCTRGRSRKRWEESPALDLKEVGCEDGKRTVSSGGFSY